MDSLEYSLQGGEQGAPNVEISEETQIKWDIAYSSEEGEQMVAFMDENETEILFNPQKHTGAGWKFGDIYLDSDNYSLDPDSKNYLLGLRTHDYHYALSLIAHEAKHLEQMKWRFFVFGYGGALSVYGELEAWQVQNKVLTGLGETLDTNRIQLDLISLDFDIDNLRDARYWMGKDDPGYAWRLQWLPSYPLGYYFLPLGPWSFDLLR
jgi:hypothetical protein